MNGHRITATTSQPPRPQEPCRDPFRSRTTRVIAGTVTALAVLTACGGGGDDTANKPNGPVTLTFWGWAKGTKDVVDAFNASHTDVKVTFEEILRHRRRLRQDLQRREGGQRPDLVSIEYSSLPEFVSSGALQDIGGEFTEADRAELLPQSVELTTLGGRTWAVPFDASPQAFFYRKDLFEKYKIQVPATWDDFKKAAEQVKKADAKARIATFFPDDPTTFEAMAWQAGAQWFKAEDDTWKVNTTDPATTKVTAYWQGLLDAGLVHKNASFSPSGSAPSRTAPPSATSAPPGARASSRAPCPSRAASGPSPRSRAGTASPPAACSAAPPSP